MKPALVTFAALGVTIAGAGTADAIEVRRSIEINAPPAQVWGMMGSFCAIAAWHPVIAKCTEETQDGQTLRTLETGDGGKLLERLIASDGTAHRYSYAILESPLPVENYVSTLRVLPTANGSRVIWESSFDPKGASEAAAGQVIGGIYDAGLQSLKEQIED
jgi:hypothetical protein